MKTIIFTLSLFCLITTLTGQENESGGYIEFSEQKVGEAETFTSGGGVHGIFVSLNTKYGQIAKDNALFFGGRISYVANNKMEIGLGGHGFYSDYNLASIDEEKIITGGYGGLHLEPIFFGLRKIHLSVPIFLGAGGIGIVDKNDIDFDQNDEDWDPYFIIEPGVNVVFKISNYLQLEAGIQYRISNEVTLIDYPQIPDMNGLSLGIGIKMGVFNIGRKKMVQTKVTP